MNKIQQSIQRNLFLILEESENLQGWGNSKKQLSKTFTFDDFKDSMKFVNNVARIAEKQNHHPDITVNYNKVKLTISDHEKGRVSEKCIKFVKEVDKL